jgi:glycerophosphoryl diester phosphodiesterase
MHQFPGIIAHRGGRDWAPENTLAAFHKSVELGVDGVEFDVHRCSSGELVVIHDDDLQRTTNGVGLVKESSLPELKRLSAGLWYDKTFREEKIPLLTEVLDVLKPGMLIDIELKNAPIGYEGIEEDLLNVIEPYRQQLNLAVSSFDHHCLRRLRALDSDIDIGVLCSANLIDIAEYAEKFKAKYYIQDYDCLLPEAVYEAKAAGLNVIVWTVNDVYRWQKLIDLGVDGICTDSPAELAVLRGNLLAQ